MPNCPVEMVLPIWYRLSKALEKANLAAEDLDYILAGDLLNQCIGTSFGLRDFNIPFYGLYGACSTMGESLALGSLLISGGCAESRAAYRSPGTFGTGPRRPAQRGPSRSGGPEGPGRRSGSGRSPPGPCRWRQSG